MARKPRPAFAGAIYHVTMRGVERRIIFTCDRERDMFLALLLVATTRCRWRVHAYCLMDNHYHLLIETPEPNISRGMQVLNSRYAQWFNREHGRKGHLFETRFDSVLIRRDSHLLEVARYVVLNRVRAGACRTAGDWRWSSYRATAGTAPQPAFLTVGWLLRQFAPNRDHARARYRDFVARGMA